MTAYLTVPQLLFLHMRLVEATGGAHGIRDMGLLQAAAARPQATFDGRELYPDQYSKAAAMLHSLILNHPMTDGNKRLGIAAAGLFLERNGLSLTADNAELETFTLRVAMGGVAMGGVAMEEITDWFPQHTQPDSSF